MKNSIIVHISCAITPCGNLRAIIAYHHQQVNNTSIRLLILIPDDVLGSREKRTIAKESPLLSLLHPPFLAAKTMRI